MEALAGDATVVAALGLGQKPQDIHVLLVDDEKVSRLVVGNLLRKCNYQVTVAASGLEAIDLLRRHGKETYHIILTDVMMPDVDGIELLNHIRSDESFNSMPVVMMSANEHTETVFECIRRGAEDYLLKPVTKKEVQYICQHVWRRQKQGPSRVPFMEQHEAQEHAEAHANALRPDVEDGGADRSAVADMLDIGHEMNGAAHQGVEQEMPESSRQASHEVNETDMADRRLSGLQASSSGRNNDARQARQQQGPVAGGVAGSFKMPLSFYFQKRGMTVNSSDSFRIFCSAVALLQAQHEKGEVVRVRPSRLCLTSTGSLVFGTCSQRQTEIEDKLYASPEELLNKPLSMASDIYSLGVLFFELFYPVTSGQERMQLLSGLRHRILPLKLLQQRVQEAEFVLSLLHPDPTARPSIAKVTQPSCLTALQQSILAAHAESKGRDSLDLKALLDFLRRMQENKEKEANNIRGHIDIIDHDIKEVSQRLQEMLGQDKRKSQEGVQLSKRKSTELSSQESDASLDGQHKRDRDWVQGSRPAQTSGRKSFDEAVASGEDLGLRSKWKRIWEEYPVLETMYMKQREASQALKRLGMVPGTSECAEETRGSSQKDQLTHFTRDLSMLARHHQLEVKASLKYGDLMGEGDMVCSAAFDRDDEFFATAGVSKRIKVFELANVVDEAARLRFPVLEIGVNSKVSSLCWNSYVKMCLLAADYEGAIQLWDVSTNSVTAQYEEHLKRVWSVDFSQTDPTRFVSGSDDGTVKLWSMRDHGAVATIDSKANVCSVQLSPIDSNLMAFGSANHRIYLYDLRKMATPLSVISGHKKAVSYVRFLDGKRIISASTDSTLKLWDIKDAATPERQSNPLTVYTGHTNERNFVGLSVNPKGYIACGSESNEVFTYYHSIPLPLTHHSFAATSKPVEAKADGRQFVSTVCWARKGNTLLAANSAGVIKVLSLKD